MFATVAAIGLGSLAAATAALVEKKRMEEQQIALMDQRHQLLLKQQAVKRQRRLAESKKKVQEQKRRPLVTENAFTVPTNKQQSENELDAKLMSLPPHLRQYVDPSLQTNAELIAAQHQYADQTLPPAPITGPKPQYDWRRQNTECQPVNVYEDPGAIPWTAGGVEYVDQPQVKLQRTFGRDGKRLNIQGNTVPHPTGRQYLKFPVSGKEADSFLRRMTGHDPHRRQKSAVMQPTLMPDCSLGPTGEWGNSRALPGLAVETRAVDALNEMNLDNIGDGMLPFIRPDIHQWREQPVSYKKPTPQVRGPVIPDSRAGIFYRGNDIGRDPRFSEPLPALPGTDAYYRRPESMEHMQLPRESNKDYKASSVIDAPVPQLSLGSMARMDQVPFEDQAHFVLGKQCAPLMLTAIKRYHKKLQRPHTLAYGAGIHEGDEMAGAYDAASVATSLTQARAANRVGALKREQPVAPLATFTGGDGSDGDFDIRNAASVGVQVFDDEKGIRRDALAQQAWNNSVQGDDQGDYASSVIGRGVQTRAPRADATPYGPDRFTLHNDDDQDAYAGASRFVEPLDVRAATGNRSFQKRNTAHARMETFDRADVLSDYMDGQNAIGSLPISHRHGDNDRAVEQVRYDASKISDPNISSMADHAIQGDFSQKVRSVRDVSVAEQQRAGAHMVSITGDDIGFDSSAATFASRGVGGDSAIRLQQLEARRSTNQSSLQDYRARTAALQFDEGVNPGDAYNVSGPRVRAPRNDANVADVLDLARNPGAGVIEYDSAAAGVGTRVERPVRPSSVAALRDERQAAGRGMDEQFASIADNVMLASRAREAKRRASVLHDPERGAFSLYEQDAGYGAADSVNLSQQARAPRADATSVDARVGTYDAIDEQFELSAAQQQMATQAHQRNVWRREAGIVNQRTENVDSDILTGLSRATVSAPGADRPHQRFADREHNMLHNPKNNFMADELHNIVGNEMLIAPPQVHLTRVHEREDGRTSSIGLKLRSRLRSESPRPASHMERNSRFGRMLNASPCSSPRGSRAPSPTF